MTIEIAMRLSGFLFLFIIITNVASVAFGNKLTRDLDSDAELQKINDDPNRFKISIVLALIEHNTRCCLDNLSNRRRLD